MIRLTLINCAWAPFNEPNCLIDNDSIMAPSTILQAPRSLLIRVTAAVCGLYSSNLLAQSITTEPLSSHMGAVPVPVDNPWALLLLGLAIFAASFWLLRHQRHRQMLSSVLAATAVGLVLWQSPGLRAQLLSSFTNPAGETLALSVTPIPQGGDIVGFSAQHFVNNAGVNLRIADIDMPGYESCFPDLSQSLLASSDEPDPDAPPACAVGLTLGNSATCGLDIDSHCRQLWSDNCLSAPDWLDMRLIGPLNSQGNLRFHNTEDGSCQGIWDFSDDYAIVTAEGGTPESIEQACANLGSQWMPYYMAHLAGAGYPAPNDWYMCVR